jgi:hypothetical protein
MHTFTSEELLEFLFQETSAEKTEQIVQALEEDWNLKEEYNQISEAKEELSSVSFSPSQKTIHNILNYARLSTAG